MRTTIAPRLAAALAASLLLLAGCTAPTATSGGAPASAPMDATKGMPQVGAPEVAPAPDTADRQVARTASITLVVPNPADAAERVRQVAAQFDSRVTREDVYSTDQSSTSSLVLSVPADRLDAVLAALAGLGTMTSRSTTSVDVTDRVVDVDARIRTLQDSIARIRALMDRAGTVTEIATVERELTSRQSELESLLAQQASLRNRVDRTPVSVTLTTKAPPVVVNPFLQGLAGAWEAMQGSLRFLLWAAGALVPFAVLVALAWFPVRGAIRRRRHGGKTKPAAAASDQTPQPPTP